MASTSFAGLIIGHGSYRSPQKLCFMRYQRWSPGMTYHGASLLAPDISYPLTPILARTIHDDRVPAPLSSDLSQAPVRTRLQFLPTFRLRLLFLPPCSFLSVSARMPFFTPTFSNKKEACEKRNSSRGFFGHRFKNPCSNTTMVASLDTLTRLADGFGRESRPTRPAAKRPGRIHPMNGHCCAPFFWFPRSPGFRDSAIHYLETNSIIAGNE
jgi:hypothetical protein